MNLDQRLASYRLYGWTRSTDPRWEVILGDLKGGHIRLAKAPGTIMARIVVVAS